MTVLLLGHRGTGKTSFLDPIKGPKYDLDQEITARTGRTPEAWLAAGESAFRDVERDILHELCRTAKSDTVIAVGAGYERDWPPGVRKVWLRRATDKQGRSFLNRPRLDISLSPFEEYEQRFVERETRYALAADEQLVLPEGYAGGLEDFLFRPRWRVEGDYTLLPEHFRDWAAFWQKRAAWGVRRWELRDDLLSPEQIRLALATIPHQQVLFARRRAVGEVPPGLKWDWPLELGRTPGEAFSISLHTRETDLAATLARFESSGSAVLKLAVEIRSFEELLAGHAWWLRDPSRRSFLPRSSGGRWRWYRSLFGPRMPVHFFREGEGSSLDQPFLWQALMQPALEERFAAVLGSPVEHSRSPLEHHAHCGAPFVAIEVAEEELVSALPVLAELGLRYVAVTSPLKKAAYAAATSHTVSARETGSANTLYIDKDTLAAHNTDVLALAEWRKVLPAHQSVWLWGGGGVQSSVKQVWPDLRAISAREGTTDTLGPDLLIWATGRHRPFAWPRARPGMVLDLNYGDDSPGLEFAVRENLPYQSGLTMFKLQAEFQRAFWRAKEEAHAGQPVWHRL